MALRLYLNHNVPIAVAEGLALRGIDVLTALADGADQLDDSALLNRATELGRVLFSSFPDLEMTTLNSFKGRITPAPCWLPTPPRSG